MTRVKPIGGRTRAARTFNAEAFLQSSGPAKTLMACECGGTIFTQGDACEDIFYVQTGGVKLTVLSKTGREGVVARLGFIEYSAEYPMKINASLLSVVLHD
jgi:CRP/FNR family transcriptional regulator, cyclic AMP receptor protein